METLEARAVIEHLGLDRLRRHPVFDELPDEVIVDLMNRGRIVKLAKGEYISRYDEVAADFNIVLQGDLAYYKHCGDHDVLTRHFGQGEQVGFDEMIGLINRDGTDVATEDSLLLTVGADQFYNLHVEHPAAFGVFMINLARELSREIEMLEDVIGKGTGWEGRA